MYFDNFECDVSYFVSNRHYIAQQGTYRAILGEYYGIKVDRMILLQLHPDQDDYVEHEVPILDEEVRIIFEQRREEVRAMKKRKELPT